VLLRREQYRRADDLEAAAGIARVMVAAKVGNARSVPMSYWLSPGNLPA
ncbi:MAG: CRISPR-associated endonuclease Cas1, partial [Proteobacteria bacterium]|nr:CRISPR-associated endonuclease Cas1 [Pseudomonadota bacterium]